MAGSSPFFCELGALRQFSVSLTESERGSPRDTEVRFLSCSFHGNSQKRTHEDDLLGNPLRR